MSGVATEHPLYEELKEQWSRCRACAAGEDAVKAEGARFLPPLDSHKLDGGMPKYKEYLLRAMFYNAVGRTIAGLSGAIFQKTPSITVEGPAKEQIKDVTLTGQPIEMFALEVTREYLTTGRYGILVDMSTELATVARPYWVGYHSEDIINWRFKNLGGDKELSLVVLREVIEDPDEEDEFKVEPVIQYRVLRLSDAGVYTQQVYTAAEGDGSGETIPGIKQGGKKYEGGAVETPTRRGRPLNFIPFSLPWTLSSPPLLDLVSVNLAHYRGNADLKHGLHYTALPTPWVSGNVGDSTQPLSIGSGTAWDLGVDGRAGMLEFTGRGLGALRTDLQDMKSEMATLGARLLQEPPKYAETALSVVMRHGSDFATLRMIAQVVEQQITYALKIHTWWLGSEELVTDMTANLELNKIFFDQQVTADELRALLLALQGGTISFKTFYDRLSNTGWSREGIDADEELADIKADGEQFLEKAKPGAQLPDPKSLAPGGGQPLPKV